MKKLIYTKKGYQLLTKEEMLKEYEGLIKKFAINCDSTLKTMQDNILEQKDYEQIASYEALKVFDSYDASKGVKFSTYLQNSLRYIYVHLLRDFNAQKRKAEKPFLELDSVDECGSGLMIHETVASKEIVDREDNVCELEKHLLNNLTKEELIFLKMGMQKQIGKAKGSHKTSLIFIVEVLEENIQEENNVYMKAELAKMLNISRPTLNKRIKLVMDKTQKLAYEYLKLANSNTMQQEEWLNGN